MLVKHCNNRIVGIENCKCGRMMLLAMGGKLIIHIKPETHFHLKGYGDNDPGGFKVNTCPNCSEPIKFHPVEKDGQDLRMEYNDLEG